MRRGWAAPSRFTPLPAILAARSRPQSSPRSSRCPAVLGALIASGAIGVLVALLLLLMNIPDAGAHRKKPGNEAQPKQAVITPALITLTMPFMLLSLSVAGINNFGVVALMSGYGASYSTANIALTAFVAASAAGVLAGGFLADHTERHGYVAAACFAANAAIVLLIALVTLPGAGVDRSDDGPQDSSPA